MTWCKSRTFWQLLFVPLLFLGLAIPEANTATRGIGMVPIKTKDGQQIGLYKGSYALVIGVSDYTAGWPDLESIPGELDLLSKALESKGFNVTRVNNPNSRQLERAFSDFIDTYGYEPDNRLLFFYSGHGYTRNNGRKGYLVPSDAPDPREDDRGFARKSLTMGQILSWAKDIESKHALFLFDSCFSGTIFKTKALPKIPPNIRKMTVKPVRQFITAGSAGEEVPANSVFTPAFIEAITMGEGDLNGDGYVSGMELGFHLQNMLPQYTGQTPQFGKILDFELSRGDFIFQVESKKNKPPPPQKAAEIVQQAPVAPVQTAMLAPQPAAVPQQPTRVIAAVPDRNAEKIAKLLGVCQAHAKSNRLTRPEGLNALDCYKGVLALDATNMEAVKGLEGIELRYVGLAKSALQRGRLDRVESFISRIRGFSPDSIMARDLEVMLKKKSQEQAVLMANIAKDKQHKLKQEKQRQAQIEKDLAKKLERQRRTDEAKEAAELEAQRLAKAEAKRRALEESRLQATKEAKKLTQAKSNDDDEEAQRIINQRRNALRMMRMR